MTMEVYTVDEILRVIHLLETIQDTLYEGEDETWDMLQEAIEILYFEGDDDL